MFCPYCGKEGPDSSKFCVFCGKHFKAKEPTPPKAESVPEPVKLKKKEEPEILVEPKVKKPKKVKKSKLPKAKKPKKDYLIILKSLPIWGWGIIAILPIIAFFIFKPAPQIFKLSRRCSQSIKANTEQAIQLQYGYWGVMEDVLDINLDNYFAEIYVDGKLMDKNIKIEQTEIHNVPCINLFDYSEIEKSNTVWIYTVMNIGKLDKGTHSIRVTTNLTSRITDGFKDENGNTMFYGPGEIFSATYSITVD